MHPVHDDENELYIHIVTLYITLLLFAIELCMQ